MYTLLLSHIARHVTLDETSQQRFCFALEHRTLRKNEFLLKEGEVCRRDHFIIKGGLRQYETDEQGREHSIHFGLEDWWLSDRYSLLTQTPSIYNIQAMEATEVLQIKKETLDQLFQQLPRLESYFHIILQQSFAMWQSHIRMLQLPAEEKYRIFQQYYGDIEQRISQQYIASYLGVSRETLSRIRSQEANRKKNVN